MTEKRGSLHEEVWKPLVGYEKYYEVSNLGRVRSLDRIRPFGRNTYGKVLSLHKCKLGYHYFQVSVDGSAKRLSIHRSVLITFEGYQDDKEVNHIDGNKGNNRLENLEWVTSSENKKHAFKLGLRKRISRRGQENNATKLSDDEALEIKRRLEQGETQTSIAKHFSMRQSHISRIKRGVTWSWLNLDGSVSIHE